MFAVFRVLQLDELICDFIHFGVLGLCSVGVPPSGEAPISCVQLSFALDPFFRLEELTVRLLYF